MNLMRSSLLELPFKSTHPPEQGECNTFMNDPNAQDVVAMTPKLPGRTVDAENPRLGNSHPADDKLGNDGIVKLKPPFEALEAFVLGSCLGLAFKAKSQFTQVDRFHFQQRQQEQR